MSAAYDYKTQRWVTGEAARPLRAAQLREELAVLESARGSEYLAFLGMSLTLPAAIAGRKQELAECQRAEQAKARREFAHCSFSVARLDLGGFAGVETPETARNFLSAIKTKTSGASSENSASTT